MAAKKAETKTSKKTKKVETIVDEVAIAQPTVSAETVDTLAPTTTPENNDNIEKAADMPEKTKKKAAEQTAKHSKRYTSGAEKINDKTPRSTVEAMKLVKETATTKFTGSVEVHLNLYQKGLRGFVSLPNATGSKKRLLIFGNVTQTDGIIPGDDASIEDIASGKLTPGKDFDMVVATPAFMPKLAKVAKILGPRGLMPNPKSGTVTDDPEKTLNAMLGGKVEYKSEANAPILHMAIGKTNLEADKLTENYTALIAAIGSSKIRSASVNATMGPGIPIKIA